MASVVALSGAIAPGIYRSEGRCDLVLAEVRGPLTTAVGDLRHFRVNFSEAALTLNIAVPDGVEATAKNGNLTLTGTVSYGAERTAAEDTVAGLTGVRNLSDDIVISNDANPVDVTLSVQEALDRHALIPDDSDVAVDTDGNTVTLSGHLRTWAEHDAVVDAAWMAVGVYDVRDNLYVTG